MNRYAILIGCSLLANSIFSMISQRLSRYNEEWGTVPTIQNQNVYILEFVFGIMIMSAILILIPMISTAIKDLLMQIGPQYDPLFYDVSIYIFGVMLFAVFLLSVIAFWLRRKGLGGGAAKEKWTQELERYFEREQIGLIPDEKHHW